MHLAAFQFMEQSREERGERWRLGRLQQRYSGFPKVRCAPRASSQGRNQRDPEARRTIVQLLQREPGHLRRLSARPGREQGRLAKASRGRDKRQRRRKRAIKRREQTLPLHQRGGPAWGSEPTGEDHHPLVERLRGLLLTQECSGGLLQTGQREVLRPSEITLAGAASAGMVAIPILPAR